MRTFCLQYLTLLLSCVTVSLQVHLLPDAKAVYQTKLQRRTLSPVYDEQFELKLTAFSSDHQLHFGVFDFDRYSRHDLIGVAVLQPHSPDVTSERIYVLDLVAEKQVLLSC